MKLFEFLFGSRKKSSAKVLEAKSENQNVGPIENQIEKQIEYESSYPSKSCDLEYFAKHRELFQRITDILKRENIVGEMFGYDIEYETDDKDRHEINFDNVSISEHKIAWFQTSFNDKHRLRIFDRNFNFDWEPETHNPVFGCTCFFIEWLNENLIFIYKEKHQTYICSIKNRDVRYVHFHGEQFEKEDDIIYLGEYGSNRDYVRRIKIPDLNELEPVLLSDLKKRGLEPKDGYDYIYRNNV